MVIGDSGRMEAEATSSESVLGASSSRRAGPGGKTSLGSVGVGSGGGCSGDVTRSASGAVTSASLFIQRVKMPPIANTTAATAMNHFRRRRGGRTVTDRELSHSRTSDSVRATDSLRSESKCAAMNSSMRRPPSSAASSSTMSPRRAATWRALEGRSAGVFAKSSKQSSTIAVGTSSRTE